MNRQIFLVALALIFASTLSAQVNSYWNTNGNAAGNFDFIGTTNAEPLIFKTNSLEALRIRPNGSIQISAFQSQGSGLVYANNSGILNFAAFSTDSNQVFTASGKFKSITVLSGWTSTDSVLYTSAGMRIGIGTSNPEFGLDITGNMRVTDKISVLRLVPLPGDSVVHIGDSSITFNNNTNVISATTSVNQYRGLGIGWDLTSAQGFHSLAFGSNAIVSLSAPKAMVIGNGFSFGFPLTNSISNSLMIGFNSNLPTIFVAPATGINTVGKVGVGTTAPDALFQVNASSARITIDQSGTNSLGFISYIGFNVSRDPNTGYYTARGDGQQNNSGSAITQDSEGALRFYVFANTGASDQQVDPTHFETQSIMALRPDRVQIGQRALLASSLYNDPDTKLSVDGRIMCRDLIVSDIDWQDEVFDSTYMLMPLDSVAAYIERYSHLPGFAPESEVEQNGMSLSETVTQQQRTIEEMMLYILELNERMKAVEEENKKLKEGEPK